jgi:hypothetical protein
MWSAFYGISSTSRLLAQFSALVEPDSSIEWIQSCFETVLQRALKRRAIVVSARAAADEGDGPAIAAAVWNPDRRSVGAHLAQLRLSDVANARLQEAFGPIGFRTTPKIAAVVPVVSPRGTQIAIVVIGRKRLWPLTERQCALVEAGAAMAGLLLERVRLRESVRVAETQAEALRRIVEARAKRMPFSRN